MNSDNETVSRQALEILKLKEEKLSWLEKETKYLNDIKQLRSKVKSLNHEIMSYKNAYDTGDKNSECFRRDEFFRNIEEESDKDREEWLVKHITQSN